MISNTDVPLGVGEKSLRLLGDRAGRLAGLSKSVGLASGPTCLKLPNTAKHSSAETITPCVAPIAELDRGATGNPNKVPVGIRRYVCLGVRLSGDMPASRTTYQEMRQLSVTPAIRISGCSVCVTCGYVYDDNQEIRIGPAYPFLLS